MLGRARRGSSPFLALLCHGVAKQRGHEVNCLSYLIERLEKDYGFAEFFFGMALANAE